jgi:hypothetical protein
MHRGHGLDTANTMVRLPAYAGSLAAAVGIRGPRVQHVTMACAAPKPPAPRYAPIMVFGNCFRWSRACTATLSGAVSGLEASGTSWP